MIVDKEGRTIDATTGEEIQLTHRMPTLKVKILTLLRVPALDGPVIMNFYIN